METPALIARLKDLKAISEQGFESQQACISWANEVAPLLAFDEGFHDAFLENANYVNTIGLSANLQGTSLNFMVSILQQAIVSLERGPIASPATQVVPLQVPERMTLAWLWKHVPASYAVAAATFVIAVFVAGVGFSQTKAFTVITDLASTVVGKSNTAVPIGDPSKQPKQ